MYKNGFVSVRNCLPLRDEERAPRLRLHEKSPSALVIFRMLLGGVEISLGNGRVALQPSNYLALGAPEARGYSISGSILQAFPGLGQQDRDGNFMSYTVQRSLDAYFKSTGTQKGFFDVLLNEMSRAFVARSAGNDLSAFVYLYRAVEHMSYALPIFHARHSSNYIKAFSDLRELLSKGDGELKFCDKFVAHIFRSDPIGAHKFNLTYPSSCSEKVLTYLKGNHSKKCSVGASSAEVEFLNAFGFVVDVRNKFFHHLSGSNQSASSRQIEDADAFFGPINVVATSLISLILCKIIAAEI